MCGICGYVGRPDLGVIMAMRDVLTHRGPDEAGEFCDDRVALGHRRLSIIDLQHGAQPMHSADGTLVLVFNGEIYNHRELREELRAAGFTFQTTSDTEVVLRAYEAFGRRTPERLDGMFSFVVYDRRRHCLFGARDRFGKKPLYYTTTGLGEGRQQVSFAFASELKSLREHPAIASRLRLSEEALVSYLLNDYVLGEQRIFEHVRQLPAGGACEFGLAGSSEPGFQSWNYWDISFDRSLRPGEAARQSEAELAEQLLCLLRGAVERRLIADVPLGALLSGGIDSSCIVALMTEFRPADRIETFSIGFDEASFDELEYAQHVARRLGVRHFYRRFTTGEMLRQLPHVIERLDEPFADPSILPYSLLCEFARERVTVALGGDGGDELFAGYDPFRAVRAAAGYRRWVPPWLHARCVLPLTRCLPASSKNMSLQFKAARFLRGAREDGRLRAAVWMGAFDLQGLGRLMPDLRPRWPVDRAYAQVIAAHERLNDQHADAIDQTLDFFQRFYLVDDILVKADRASMMHSLEVRSPFLDTALAEFVNSLPNTYKLRSGATKYLLKKALLGVGGGAPLLPVQIVQRRKKGFGIPVARWIRHELRTLFQTTLVDDWPETELPMIDARVVQRLFDEHVRGRENNYKELWALFVLALWARRHLSCRATTTRTETRELLPL